MKPVFVIMVTYRRFEYFKATVESLLPTLPAGSRMAIVYNREGRHEDDLRYEGYLRKLTAEHDFVEVLDTGTNEGWGASMNEGLHLYGEWKEFEYVLESNNDVTYDADWCARAQSIMEKHLNVGILALWRHMHHGMRQQVGGSHAVMDNAPATAWFMRSEDLSKFLPFSERGAVNTRGGNGEDTDMVTKVQGLNKHVSVITPDAAHHMDGYDLNGLGKVNEAYA